jgi:hypothetical protein
MVRALSSLVLSAAVLAAGLAPAGAQGDKQSEIKGGIEATLKKVDAEKGTLTVTTANGRDHTFTVTDDTTIVGPRGGVVRRRLSDPRFHPGLEVTVVASGTTAKEVHLGYDRKDAAETPAPTKTEPAAKGKPGQAPEPAATPSKRAPAAKADEEDDEDEFPGKIKSADPARRMLVITLLNGKDRSFLLARDVKITVKGAASTRGLEDPALKPNIPVTVVTEPGGRKVKEVQVAPPAARGKKAG